jgi:septin family protein
MDDKDKITVAKTVNAWKTLGNLNQSVLLIGPSHTGRTTFAELVKKYLYDSPNAALLFDGAKSNYILEGVISSKSIKVQTAYPVLYEKSRKDKEELKLVDVPCFIYAP